MGAKDLLAELNSLVASEVPFAPTPKVSLVKSPPSVDRGVLEQARVLCDRATILMETSIQAQMKLVEVLAQIRALGVLEAESEVESPGGLPVEEPAPESGEGPVVEGETHQ